MIAHTLYFNSTIQANERWTIFSWNYNTEVEKAWNKIQMTKVPIQAIAYFT